MKERIYSDYFMPNRYKEYEAFLKLFLDNGYNFICVKEFEKLKDKTKKYIILRHDIDSDIKIAQKMFEIEKKLEIKSTYYFRLCTINRELIKQIDEYGSEVGYHYEEIAQYCKDNKNISKEYVISNLDKIKLKLIDNIKAFEDKNKVKLYSIASHGDFINRKIGLTNKFLYQQDMKEKLGLIEAYDIEENINFRTADNMYPKYWKEEPNIAIDKKINKVLILVHPRWWASSPIERFKLDIGRILEGLIYR